MDCAKLTTIFEACLAPHFKPPRTNQEILINEAQKYNCILLSNTIQKQCNGLAMQNETLYQPLDKKNYISRG